MTIKPEAHPMDLQLLHARVLRGPDYAALPVNLPDDLLNQVLHCTEEIIKTRGECNPSVLSGPLALILHMRGLQASDLPEKLSDAELYDCIQSYRIELSLETLRRLGVKLVEAATVENIFGRNF